jgi:hypothetical protein
MSDTFDWPTLRARAIESFGSNFPLADQEQIVIDAFTAHPRAVAAAIDKLGESYKQGRVRVPWAVLKKEAEGILAEPTAITATDTSERERTIKCARIWLTNAGIHFDREDEVREELLRGPSDFARGSLQQFADDPALMEELLDMWRAKRAGAACARG